MADEHPMTVGEFNNLVTKWAMKIRAQARGTLSRTKASGKLSIRLAQYVDQLSNDKPVYKVKFDFERYGVFRHYGVGRGYILVNGTIVRGWRVRSDREIRNKTWNTETADMHKRGYSNREINKAKKILRDGEGVQRTQLDWIDGHIDQNIHELADLVQGYYGDDALRQMIKNIDKLKIKKQ